MPLDQNKKKKTTDMNIGFIGLGAMGSPMVQTLLDAGRRVSVWGRSPEILTKALGAGARQSPSAADLSRDCTFLLLSVTDTAAVEEIVFGARGIAEGGSSGKVLVDFSTIDPDKTLVFAGRLKEEAGMGWVDAPVSGGTKGAAEGRLSIMAGGDLQDIERVRPVIEPLFGRFTHLGPVGSGQIAKACNQLIIGGTIAVISEALRAAFNAGIDPERLPEALAGGWADSNVLQLHGRRMAEVIQNSSSGGKESAQGAIVEAARTSLMLKDMEIASELARMTGTPMPVTALVTEFYRMVLVQGHRGEGQIGLMHLLHR
jgi:3-hydroxyisobutyrate dehydrogenase